MNKTQSMCERCYSKVATEHVYCIGESFHLCPKCAKKTNRKLRREAHAMHDFILGQWMKTGHYFSVGFCTETGKWHFRHDDHIMSMDKDFYRALELALINHNSSTSWEWVETSDLIRMTATGQGKTPQP